MITCMPSPVTSIPRTRPRRPLRSRLTSPMNRSGTRISTFMIGSWRTGLQSMTPFLRAIEAASWNDRSFESTVWNEPS